jgi:hypothetical protein
MSEIVEVMPVADVYADDLGAVELLGGGNVRLIWYAWCGPATDRSKVAVAKLILPIAAVTDERVLKLIAEQKAVPALREDDDGLGHH